VAPDVGHKIELHFLPLTMFQFIGKLLGLIHAELDPVLQPINQNIAQGLQIIFSRRGYKNFYPQTKTETYLCLNDYSNWRIYAI
jgi:hypothetical protein